MRLWEIAKLRDEFLYAARKDEDELAAWAKQQGAELILALGQLSDALAFWVKRSDRFEREIGGDLPSVTSIRGVGSWAYAVGRQLVPTTDSGATAGRSGHGQPAPPPESTTSTRPTDE